jgi:beta-lactamase superfamily II metal-dependent hydrolase
MEKPSFTFWPVGNGDSTTIHVGDGTVVQIDIHHLEAGDDEDDPRIAVIDALVALLPEVDGKPYLAAFALTHADEDHCKGFEDLLDRVTIGDLWFGPYVLRDEPDLCPDAEAFCKEARRRVDKNIEQQTVGSGDRVRVIGDHDLLREDKYAGLPEDCLVPPGSAFSSIDGQEHGETFRVFVHGPVGSEDEIERNDTSLAMQVTLAPEGTPARLLLLGDLAYPGVKRVFDESEDINVSFDILQAPHHCSKSVFYFQDEDEDEPTLKQDLVDQMAAAAADQSVVVASCVPIPAFDAPGADPPHAAARARYEEIASAVLVTGEYPSVDAPAPMVFEVGETIELRTKAEQSRQTAAEAVTGGRGSDKAPGQAVGFGWC